MCSIQNTRSTHAADRNKKKNIAVDECPVFMRWWNSLIPRLFSTHISFSLCVQNESRHETSGGRTAEDQVWWHWCFWKHGHTETHPEQKINVHAILEYWDFKGIGKGGWSPPPQILSSCYYAVTAKVRPKFRKARGKNNFQVVSSVTHTKIKA